MGEIMKMTRARPGNRTIASAGILAQAERALESRRTVLLAARKIWQENLTHSEAELTQLNEQLARLRGNSESLPTPSYPDSDTQSIEFNPTFKLHY